MIEYKFPEIKNIDVVLDAIKGYDEFIIKTDKENNLLIVNYLYTTQNTFLHPDCFDTSEEKLNAIIRKECRGIEFDSNTGDIVTRKYHKFHNLNEKPEYQENAIDWSQQHWVLDKLDGSMITFYLKNGDIQAHTKMGKTDIAGQVDKFISQSDNNYREFFLNCREGGFTPLFEWCSRQQKIVVDYPIDNLILTGIRDTISGNYFSYDEMVKAARNFSIPVVRAYNMTVENSSNFLKQIRDFKNLEGVIVRFESGHMCKVKGDWYSQLHHSIDLVKWEKDVLSLVLSENLDDALPLMVDTSRIAVEKYADIVLTNVAEYAKRLAEQTIEYKSKYDKKTFAVDIIPTIDKKDRPFFFKIWDGHDALTVVKETIKRHCSTQNTVNEVRYIFNAHWINQSIDDD